MLYDTSVAVSGNSIRLSMPLMKVDESKRLVHGFATLDNLDKQDDIVTRSASSKAFERFRGNIREQHDPKKAVGKVVTFKEDSVFDPETGKAYTGVFVSAYVSKGAEDTWQKVLDGTLTGFSIGGAIKDTEVAYDEDVDKTIRIIHDYDLVELSLVDSPANQLANVVSIEKLEDGNVVIDTPLVKGDIENVFWCKGDNLVVVRSSDEEACAVCDLKMENVGFVESGTTDKTSAIKSLMKSHAGKDSKAKEANIMAEETMTEDVASEEVAKSEEIVEESAPEMEAEVEKAEDTQVEAEVEEVVKSEDAVEEDSVEKTDAAADKVDELTSVLVSSLTTLTDAVKSLNGRIEEMSKSLNEDMASVKKEVSEVKSSTNSLGKRVDSVEDTTAFRKSGDLGEVAQEQEIQKSSSPWGGRFLNAADL